MNRLVSIVYGYSFNEETGGSFTTARVIKFNERHLLLFSMKYNFLVLLNCPTNGSQTSNLLCSLLAVYDQARVYDKESNLRLMLSFYIWT